MKKGGNLNANNSAAGTERSDPLTKGKQCHHKTWWADVHHPAKAGNQVAHCWSPFLFRVTEQQGASTFTIWSHLPIEKNTVCCKCWCWEQLINERTGCFWRGQGRESGAFSRVLGECQGAAQQNLTGSCGCRASNPTPPLFLTPTCVKGASICSAFL